jgi:hypothetical protein
MNYPLPPPAPYTPPPARDLTTAEFAAKVGVKDTTVRVRYCRSGSYYGIVPKKFPSGRLLWPADGPDRLANGGDQTAVPAAAPPAAPSTRPTRARRAAQPAAGGAAC